jgi:hypothetical protein
VHSTISSVVLAASTLAANEQAGSDRISMRLDVEVNAPRVVVRENVPVTVRVVNPNPFPVELPRFAFCYEHPELQVSGDGDNDFISIGSRGGYLSNPRDVLSVPAEGSVSFARLLDDGFDYLRWPMEPGTYYLRAYTPGGRGRAKGEENSVPIDWEYVPVRVDVRSSSALDRRAMDFMGERLRAYRRLNRAGKAEPYATFRERLYTEFLERFPESTYAPETKWHLAKVLADRLGSHDVPEEEAARERWAALFKECLGFCLERGGPYAEPFVNWKPVPGGSGAFHYALSNRLFEAAEMLADALDRRYPNDMAAKRYRRGLIAYKRGSMAEAEKHFAVIEKESPENPYARDIRHLRRTIERAREGDGR